jgi:hypothetical protein
MVISLPVDIETRLCVPIIDGISDNQSGRITVVPRKLKFDIDAATALLGVSR